MVQDQPLTVRNDRMRREHYVPQFHLRNWADADEMLWCYDKVDDVVRHLGPKDVAVEKGYFRVTLPDGSKRSLEDTFSNLEGIWSSAIRNVIAQPPPDADIIVPPQQITLVENGPELINFVAVQLLRPRFVRSLLAADATAPLTDTGDPLTDSVALLHATLVGQGAVNIPPLLGNLTWRLIYNHTDTPFWASDNPVVVHANNVERPTVAPVYDLLRSRGVRLHLPLTPELALAIFDPNEPLPIPSSGIVEQDWVWRVNCMVVRAALRQIISCRLNFDAARQMVADDPDLRRPAHENADWAPQARTQTEIADITSNITD